MIGLGTALNVVAIAGGGAMGVLVGHKLHERTRALATDVLGLVTGMSAVLSARQVMSTELSQAVGSTWPLFIVLFSLLLGGAIGSALRIEDRLEDFGAFLKRKLVKGEDARFLDGFLTAALIFCIGPLAILGAFDDALGLGVDKLVLKSILDFVASIAFAASLGWGVAASAIAVGIYQGSLTVLGVALGNILSTAQIDAMTAVGGLLLMAISLRLLDIKRISTGNLLPALFIAPGLVWVLSAFGIGG